jgi:hypothetical protein
MAQMLVDSLTEKKLDFGKYRETYSDRLRQADRGEGGGRRRHRAAAGRGRAVSDDPRRVPPHVAPRVSSEFNLRGALYVAGVVH